MEEGLTFDDYFFIITMGLMAFCIIGFVFSMIKHTFKNLHLKLGDKIEIGVETKEEKKENEKH